MLHWRNLAYDVMIVASRRLLSPDLTKLTALSARYCQCLYAAAPVHLMP